MGNVLACTRRIRPHGVLERKKREASKDTHKMRKYG